ncbi:AP2-associated protein kinase 1 isoform X2 [Toxorhynchites rutilus septentrionalis]|uniref:AP2-associated protein kinase 1 isoform X2 n=1 Tax=Toxorhynchites rutilus septentrionalis TaxID=329112 RepID=UPI00247AADB2|nr:AP2-associated protein kinase 1 isoform X2 [Toxorhynchites rutilus septentrionalis]
MECEQRQFERPAFWRIPKAKTFDLPFMKKRVSFNEQVQVNSPAQKELLRGDIITKIDQYDARDLTHNDAQNLFRDASNQIKVTIRRDDTVALYQSAHEKNDVGSAGYSPALSPIPPAHSAQPYKPYGQPAPAQPFQQQPQQPKAQPHLNFPPPEPSQLLPSVNSSLPHGPQAYAAALEHPVETLPHTAFPKLDASGAYQLPKTPYPPPMVPNFDEANEAITNQPYRTTPLVLPGAKVPKMDALPTESYLRHHPNPAMRAPPVHDYTDTLMRQKVAETVIHRVVGDEPANGPKIVHKQFNSPIGLYSDSNIENTIRQTAPQTQAVPSNGFTSRHRPTKIEGYKKTVVFDPSKSETYRALQEGAGEGLQEVTTPIQPRTFQPNRLVPGKKPNANHPAPQPEFAQHVNSMGEPNEKIQQSGSFRRLMHHVLAETDY